MKQRITLLGALLMLAVAATPHEAADLHFALSKSAPEADTNLESPPEVRLWFTQAPQDNSMSIRLIDHAGEALEMGEPKADEEDDQVYSLTIEGTLDSGAYTVAWRAIGQDGHVVRGDFSFTVTQQ